MPYCSSNQHHRYGWYPYKVELQRFKCFQCGELFISLTNPDLLPYRHTLQTINLAMKCYLHYGVSFRKLVELLFDLHHLKISHVTIAHWFCHFVKQVHKFQRGLTLLISDQWPWMRRLSSFTGGGTMCRHIKRMASDAVDAANHAPKHLESGASGFKNPKKIYSSGTSRNCTAGLASYVNTIPRLFFRICHQRYVKFQYHPPNNLIKLSFSTFKL